MRAADSGEPLIYRREVSPTRVFAGHSWAATLYRQYAAFEGVKAQFYAVAFDTFRTKAEAEAYLDTEERLGRLFMVGDHCYARI